jgi:rSAM/selenodomain-associated transferase 1
VHAADDRILAIMMKAPRAGRVKTRLGVAYAPQQIVELYRALVDDTFELARQLPVRTVAVCPAGDETALAEWLPPHIEIVVQRGTGLAAGLESTFEQLCTDAGYPVIAFDADSPHVPANAIEWAFAALAGADLVVGPCDDGGYYLVGARRCYAHLFDAAAVGGQTACDALMAAAAQQRLRVAVGASYYDVDLPGDLSRLARDLADAPTRAPRTAALLSRWELRTLR